MSLTRTDTGQTAKPLEQLQEINESKRKELEDNLLKEALAISNEKCNDLIVKQNAHIKELTSTVEQVRKNNDEFQMKIRYHALAALDRTTQLVEQEREFKKQVSQEIAEAMKATADDVTNYAKCEMDKSTEEVKRQIAESAKEIEKQREEMKLQGKFRKFMFWATPILLLVQSIAIIISLL